MQPRFRPALECLEARSLPSGPSAGGFQIPVLASGSYVYKPDGSPWTFNNSAGLTTNGSAFTSGNPSAPVGTQVAFIQGTGNITQSLPFLAGTYDIIFSAAQRANVQASAQTFQVKVDGSVVGTFNNLPGKSYTTLTTSSFSVSGGSHTITFQGTNLNAGDNTVFLGQVSINALPTSLADSGFESPALPRGTLQTDPTSGSPWTFVFNGSGLASNGSALTAGNPNAPQGSQVAYLQGASWISQSVTFPAGIFTISFFAAQRANVQASSQTFQVLVDGLVVGTFNTLVGTSYTALSTSPFEVSAGSHTIEFQATDLHQGDNTVFIDQVAVAPASLQTPTLAYGTFQYNPTGSSWAFSGSAGLAAVGSAFTSGNPSPPEGSQVAFLQGRGSAAENVIVPAGAYTISFSAAQRGNVQASAQTFQVKVDGSVVGTFNNLTGTGYTSLTTSSFAAGSHTITFLGTDLNGGDNTVFINQVVLNQLPTTTLPEWTENFPGYSQDLGATGGTSPSTYSATGRVPPGLTLSTSGVLSGTPTSSGIFQFSVTATDSTNATSSRAYTVTINLPLTIDTTYLPNYTQHQYYLARIIADGGTGTLTFGVSGTPPAALFPDGELSGFPLGDGTYMFTVIATDAVGATASRTYVVNPTVAITPTSLPNWTLNRTGYSQTLTATGTGTVNFSEGGGVLPPGLTLTTSGVLSGTPSATGSFAFTINAGDSIGEGAAVSYTVTINPQVMITTTTLAGGVQNQSYSQTLSATGGTGSKTFGVTSGTLPPGLTLSTGGVVSGTPTSTGTYDFTVTASDSVQATAAQSYTLTIIP